MLTVETRAIDACEPRQVRKKAALNKFVYVPRGRLARARLTVKRPGNFVELRARGYSYKKGLLRAYFCAAAPFVFLIGEKKFVFCFCMSVVKPLGETMPLTLPSCPNFRNFDGYRKKDGGITKNSPFYRSDSLAKLTREETALIEAAKLGCVIDLRYDTEIAQYPNPFGAGGGRVKYYNISLTNGLSSSNLDSYLNLPLAEFYISLLNESKQQIVQVFAVLAEHAESGAVFHCTAGKDRTGVVAALLLDLNGVAADDIVRDYAKTYDLLRDYLEEDKKKLRAKGSVLKDHVFLSEPADMERFMAYLQSACGDAEDYFHGAGLSRADIAALKNVL